MSAFSDKDLERRILNVQAELKGWAMYAAQEHMRNLIKVVKTKYPDFDLDATSKVAFMECGAHRREAEVAT